MSLTPASDDPNRKAELKRKQAAPDVFDGNGQDTHPTKEQLTSKASGLVADDPERNPAAAEAPADEAPADEAPKDNGWTDFLAQSVPDLTAQLSGMEDGQLEAMREAEMAAKARVTLLSAIEEELTQRQGA